MRLSLAKETVEIPVDWKLRDLPDEALVDTFLRVFGDDSLRKNFAIQSNGIDSLFFNPDLPVMIRSFRRVESWRIFILLTPWMLSRILSPVQDPELRIPQVETKGTESTGWALGPRIAITLLGQRQDAHLQYTPDTGHFLLQPLMLGMAKHRSAEEVFQRWGDVVRAREKVRENIRWQQNVSRREMFSRMFSASSET